MSLYDKCISKVNVHAHLMSLICIGDHSVEFYSREGLYGACVDREQVWKKERGVSVCMYAHTLKHSVFQSFLQVEF